MAGPDGPADRRGDGSSRPRGPRPLALRFTIRYAAAVLVIAVVALAALWTVSSTLDDIESADEQLLVAAAQPSRINHIVELGRELDAAAAAQDSERMDVAASQLEQEAVALRQSQSALIEGDDQLGVTMVDLGPQLQELYLGSGRLNQRISTFASSAEVLAGFAGLEDGANRVEPRRQLEEAQEQLVVDLQSAVTFYGQQIDREVGDQRDTNLLLLLASVLAASGIVLLLFRPMARQIRSETAELEEAERRSRASSSRATFRGETKQALELCRDEEEVLGAAGRGMASASPNHAAELLMVDATRVHLRPAATSSVGAPGCPVDDPKGCAALRAGQSVAYDSSRMLNVCPKLPEHAGGPCSAMCLPLTFDGEALGVLHATGAEHQNWDEVEVERLHILAAEVAIRLGTLRVTKATERLAARDGLTDLDNRRTLFLKAEELVASGMPFSIGVADLDHFKDLNDTFGHETGDRALQAFAACLRRQLRPQDVVARYGGEEFVVLLPETSVESATSAIERVQSTLPSEIEAAGSVPFTASWGLSEVTPGASFEARLRAADTAMYQAKRAGRDRVVVARTIVRRRAPRRQLGAGPDGPSEEGEPAAEGPAPASDIPG